MHTHILTLRQFKVEIHTDTRRTCTETHTGSNHSSWSNQDPWSCEVATLPPGPPGLPIYAEHALLKHRLLAHRHDSTMQIIHTVSPLTNCSEKQMRHTASIYFILADLRLGGQTWFIKVPKQALAFMNEHSQDRLFLTRWDVAIRTRCPAFPPQWFITVVHLSPFIVRCATRCIPVAVADSRNKSVTGNKRVWEHRLHYNMFFFSAEKVRNWSIRQFYLIKLYLSLLLSAHWEYWGLNHLE